MNADGKGVLQINYIGGPKAMPPFEVGSVALPQFTMGDIYRAALPFLVIERAVLGLCMLFPALGTWLPSLIVQ